MFLKPTETELFTHFKAIADAIPETPVLLYNNPGRVGYGLSADIVTELAHDVANIVGMKDTSGDITLTEECVRRNRDVDFKVFGGKAKEVSVLTYAISLLFLVKFFAVV